MLNRKRIITRLLGQLLILPMFIVCVAPATLAQEEDNKQLERKADRERTSAPQQVGADSSRDDRVRERRDGHRWEDGNDRARRDGRRGWPGRGQLDPEARQTLIEVISDLRPMSEEDRQRLAAMEWEEFRKLMNERGSMVVRLARIKQNDPELYQLKIEEFKLMQRGMKLASQLKQAKVENNDDQVASLETEFRALVAEHVDLGYQIREREIAAVESRLADMKKRLSEERANRDQEIEHRLEMLREGPMQETQPHWHRDEHQRKQRHDKAGEVDVDNRQRPDHRR